MKICGACAKSLPKDDYSGNQWKLNQHARRCKWCIAESCPLRVAAVHQAAEPVARHDGPPCWICLDCGPSPDGELPRRDCSCRGETSGFAHTQCLKEYADKKTFHYISVVLARTRACVDFDKWKEPYTVCPNCHQVCRCGDISILRDIFYANSASSSRMKMTSPSTWPMDSLSLSSENTRTEFHKSHTGGQTCWSRKERK